jgi:protein-tyrosine phosphatase
MASQTTLRQNGGSSLSFIDIHCHILPGLDDGPQHIDESLKMIEVAIEDGISHIFATPHIIDGMYDNRGSEIMLAVENLRMRMKGALTIYYGADVGVTFDLIERIERKEVPALNGSGYMLIEFPEYIIPPHVDNLFFNLRHRGITPIITHPERHLRLMRDLSALGMLLDSGAMCQITAMSVTGEFGKSARRACFAMIEKGFVDFVASDAHNSRGRPPILSKAYETIKKEFGNDLSEKIFFSNPKMIVEAALQEIPPKG